MDQPKVEVVHEEPHFVLGGKACCCGCVVCFDELVGLCICPDCACQGGNGLNGLENKEQPDDK